MDSERASRVVGSGRFVDTVSCSTHNDILPSDSLSEGPFPFDDFGLLRQHNFNRKEGIVKETLVPTNFDSK
jgi:hypothetical protein